MTPNEVVEFHRKCSEILSANRASILSIIDSISVLTNTLGNSYYKTICSATSVAISILENFSKQYQEDLINNIYLCLEIISKSIDDLSLPKSVAEDVVAATSYLDLDTKENYTNAAPPSLKDNPKRRLTLSDALSILSILLMIFFEIISSRPNEQLERIIAQNDTLIAQNATIIEQQTEIAENDKALYDTLSSLTDTINLVSETIKLFCEESESFQDELEGVKGSSHCPCQTDTSDSHQQDCDTKENADSLQSFNPLLE